MQIDLDLLPADEELPCADCDGTGEDPLTDQACLICHGKGVVPAFEVEEIAS